MPRLDVEILLLFSVLLFLLQAVVGKSYSNKERQREGTLTCTNHASPVTSKQDYNYRYRQPYLASSPGYPVVFVALKNIREPGDKFKLF